MATDTDVEVVIVDDASHPAYQPNASRGSSALSVSVHRMPRRVGVAGARNYGCRVARGDLLFVTDSHVRFCHAWDRRVLASARSDRVLAATICDAESAFRGYGCDLIVPFMGTRWRSGPRARAGPVQVASSAGTVVPKGLFETIGGYDHGMIFYGAAEPEFSLRAWLAGAEVVQVPKLEVEHRFKPELERERFLKKHRTYMVCNNIRFGLLYLSHAMSLQMIRHFAHKFPRHIRRALAIVESTDVWERRAFLNRNLEHDFDWFVDRFGLKDQVGLPIA
jgi:glycosyltransferase involved in cell wall biosynthesis